MSAMAEYWQCPYCFCVECVDNGQTPEECGWCRRVTVTLESVAVLSVAEYELLRGAYRERVAQADELERLRRIEGKVLAGDTVGAYDLARAVLGEKEETT